MLDWLFSAALWPARWHCGEWSQALGWTYVISDLTTWGAYTTIPAIIAWTMKHHPEVPWHRAFWLFFAFILLCGLTHLMDALTFWWPAYRLSALLRLCTALVSMTTVVVLTRDLPRILGLYRRAPPCGVSRCAQRVPVGRP